MRGCKRHPGGGSQPTGSSNINSNSSGVCSTCLEERLTWLWRGENFQPGSAEEIPVTSSAPDELSGASATHEPLDIAMNSNSISAAAAAAAPLSSSSKADAAIAVVASIASIRKQLQVNGVVTSSGSNDADAAPPNDESERHNNNNGGLSPDDCETTSSDTFFDGGNRRLFNAKSSPLPFSHDIKDVMKEWADLHSKRRAAMAETDDSPTKSRSGNLNPDPPSNDIIPASALSIGSRSLPLLNSTAEETALRVISEQATQDQFFEELELHQAFDATTTTEVCNLGGRNHSHALLHEDLKEQACFSPGWQGKLSSKWVKVLVNPMISRNKVFPSRSKEDVRKTQARSSSSSSHSHRNRHSSGIGNRRTPTIGAASTWDLHEAGDRVHIPRIRSSSPFDVEDAELSMEGMSVDRILQQEYMDNPLSASQDSVLSWLQVSSILSRMFFPPHHECTCWNCQDAFTEQSIVVLLFGFVD